MEGLARGPVGEWLEMVADGVRSAWGVLGPTGWWLAFLGAAGAFLVLPLLRRRA